MGSRNTVRFSIACAVLWLAGLALAPAAQQSAVPIAIRDIVVVTVIDAPEYSGKFQVEADGAFEYRQLGRVKAAGLTPAELAAALRSQLTARVFRNPQVSVDVEPSAHSKVLVTGAVRSPGAYPFAGEIRILEAVIRAGSTTEAAGDTAVLIRGVGAPETVDLSKVLAGDRAANVVLRDGDTLVIQEAEAIYVTGYVNRVGEYRLKRGMTVEQAITLAGGVSAEGNINNVRIRRPVAGQPKPEEIKVKLTDPVQAGDTIYVARRIV